MSKRLLHVLVGFALTGCTINQYGPHITMGEDYKPIVVTTQPQEEPPPIRPPVAALEDKGTHTPSPAKKSPQKPHKQPAAGCVPMPTVPDPVKMDLVELEANKTNPKKLQELFEKNHSDLYNQARVVKRALDAWYKLPNRC